MKKIAFLAVVIGLHCAASAAQDRFVAHEWGTFTSVQGADGIQIEWNPFVPLELPKFVYGQPHRRTFGLTKGEIIARQRMETPVIYFYSPTPRTVDVTVNFPEGRVTEWYPQAEGGKTGRTMKWTNLQVLAGAQISLPQDDRGSHYYAAREVPANLVQAGKEAEKFIFYRGVGSFTAPLRAMVSGANEETLSLQNAGTEPLKHFHVVQIRNGSAKYEYFNGLLAHGETRHIELKPGTGTIPLSEFQDKIGKAMQIALEKEGLYSSEATAMVNTWRDSWFGEDGVRVLYVLPRTWTDRTLPLTIQPAPDEIKRVMVGRAEVIFPSQEWKLLKQIVRYSEAAPEERPAIISEMKAIGMGRFADAALRRLLGTTPSKDFNANAWALFDAANAAGNTKSLAAR